MRAPNRSSCTACAIDNPPASNARIAKARWPDDLAARLQATAGTGALGVVNAGIGGNRLLRDAAAVSAGNSVLARLPIDVQALPNLRYICVLIGINDILYGATWSDPMQVVTSANLIAGYTEIVSKAHESGVNVLIGTLTPANQAGIAETVRLQTNAWIRAGKGFDGVLDFDAAVRDPSAPSTLLPAYNSGDGIHPNDAGYVAMANAIDLQLLGATGTQAKLKVRKAFARHVPPNGQPSGRVLPQLPQLPHPL